MVYDVIAWKYQNIYDMKNNQDEYQQEVLRHPVCLIHSLAYGKIRYKISAV